MGPAGTFHHGAENHIGSTQCSLGRGGTRVKLGPKNDVRE